MGSQVDPPDAMSEIRDLALEIVDVMDSLAFLDLPESRPMRFARIDAVAKKLLALSERVAVVRPTRDSAIATLLETEVWPLEWSYEDCRAAAERFADALIREGGVAVSDSQPVRPTRDRLQAAMQQVWNQFCVDTGDHPEFVYRVGRDLHADFSRGSFVDAVFDRLAEFWPGTPEGEGTR